MLFSQNPGIIIQVKDENEVAEILLENGISYFSIGHPVDERTLYITNNDKKFAFDIDIFAINGFVHHICSIAGSQARTGNGKIYNIQNMN